MKWKDKLNNWSKGELLTYPKNIKKNFFYETSVIDKDLNNNYKEKFIESNILNKLEQNLNTYERYFEKSSCKNVVVFDNLNMTVKLIVPKPRKGKNFTTIKNFIDEASISQQKAFWKRVSSEIKKSLKNNEKLYVSTNGLGVSYFHLRLENNPKYYLTKSFI
tara:strand:- start:15 stop:500 length:486 start_codon:yes stop_codon:yes gene_type:complete